MSQQDMMTWAMDQLRQEGVPQDNLRAAAAHLVGQAQMESGLNPNAPHDNGTGFGIYGARLGRRDAMFNWLDKNGYASNSAEGQMRYMAHEAMTGDAYGTTRGILMNATPDTLAKNTSAVTANFERPAVINNRSGAVLNAYNAYDPSKPAGAQAGSFQEAFNDFDNHMNDLHAKYDGNALNIFGGAQGGGVPGGTPGQQQPNPNLNLLALLKPVTAPSPSLAGYLPGGIPMPNYAGVGGNASTAQLLNMMMGGRQQNNQLAAYAKLFSLNNTG